MPVASVAAALPRLQISATTSSAYPSRRGRHPAPRSRPPPAPPATSTSDGPARSRGTARSRGGPRWRGRGPQFLGDPAQHPVHEPPGVLRGVLGGGLWTASLITTPVGVSGTYTELVSTPGGGRPGRSRACVPAPSAPSSAAAARQASRAPRPHGERHRVVVGRGGDPGEQRVELIPDVVRAGSRARRPFPGQAARPITR